MKKILLLLGLLSTAAFSQLRNVQRENPIRNYILNGGGEQSTANWAVTAGTLASETTTIHSGLASISFNPSASTQALSSTLVAIPAGDSACLAEFYYYGFGTADMRIYVKDNSGNVIGGYTAADTTWTISTAVTAWTKVNVPFQCPASGTTVQLVLEAQGDAAIGYIDDAYLGRDFRTGSIQGFEHIVSAQRTSSTQTISSTGATQVIYNSATLDKYSELDTSTGVFTAKIAGNVFIRAQVSLSSYTASERNILNVGGSAVGTSCFDTQDPSTSSMVTQTICSFDVAIGDTVTVKSQSVSDASYTVNNDTGTLLDIYRMPSAAQTVLRGDATDLSGTAKSAFTANCSWSTTSSSLAAFSADSDCPAQTVSGNLAAAATKIPGFIATNLLPGRYEVTAYGRFEASASTVGSAQCEYEIFDGTSSGGIQAISQAVTTYRAGTSTISGVFNYTAKSSNTAFQIRAARITGNGNCLVDADTNSGDLTFVLKPLSQAVPRPFIAGSVFYGRPNVTKNGIANLICGASSSISSNPDTMVSSIGNIATDTCTITLATGYFSATPLCTITEVATTSKLRELDVILTSATSVGVQCRESSSGTVGTTLQACNTNGQFILDCKGNN